MAQATTVFPYPHRRRSLLNASRFAMTPIRDRWTSGLRHRIVRAFSRQHAQVVEHSDCRRVTAFSQLTGLDGPGGVSEANLLACVESA
jgi:hypothetical protein